MKKLVTMLLVLVMVVGLIGCAKTEEKKATSTSTESKETQTKNDEEKAEEVVETIAEEIEEDGLEGKVLGFINAGPDDYYAQFGDAFKASPEVMVWKSSRLTQNTALKRNFQMFKI